MTSSNSLNEARRSIRFVSATLHKSQLSPQDVDFAMQDLNRVLLLLKDFKRESKKENIPHVQV